ncbi:unnamed protein product [Adineta steineri]|uniref:Myeloid leukemia factor n=1 Tax=Adineta steineri TaxID=433720 RepID=A0A819EM39_9BILA|nr:unnamed protein product [Adineta steineri]
MSLFSIFHNDPFFSGIDLPSRYDNHNRQLTQHQRNDDQDLSLSNNPFGLMQNMINQIEPRMYSNDLTGRNAHGVSFSSSTIMSMDNRNAGQPRIIQAASEQIRGPDGLERTRKAVRDTGRNLEKMEIAHRLGERGHRIIKERNASTGQLLENREFEHIDDENEFEREWFNRAERYGLKNSNGNRFNSYTNNLLMTPPTNGRLRSQSQGPRHLAIEQTRPDDSRRQQRRD